jgi:hypothetical protein
MNDQKLQNSSISGIKKADLSSFKTSGFKEKYSNYKKKLQLEDIALETSVSFDLKEQPKTTNNQAFLNILKKITKTTQDQKKVIDQRFMV